MKPALWARALMLVMLMGAMAVQQGCAVACWVANDDGRTNDVDCKQ